MTVTLTLTVPRPLPTGMVRLSELRCTAPHARPVRTALAPPDDVAPQRDGGARPRTLAWAPGIDAGDPPAAGCVRLGAVGPPPGLALVGAGHAQEQPGGPSPGP